MSSTGFEHRSVNPQEDLYIQFYGISFVHPCKQFGGWRDALATHPVIDETAYMDAWYMYIYIYIYAIKLHIQVVLRMNTWMFETCRRHYN